MILTITIDMNSETPAFDPEVANARRELAYILHAFACKLTDLPKPAPGTVYYLEDSLGCKVGTAEFSAGDEP